MRNIRHSKGFTIIELLVVIGILGVLTTIALPAYRGYIDASCLSTANINANTLRAFEENYLIENGSYLSGTHNKTDTTSALTTGLHWNPDDDGRYKYVVAAGSTGSLTTSLKITVSSANCTADAIDGN
ncbi:hypothetical protein MNBD_GAMMA09-612 [hydrothermal vent metagenome]|uniref:Type IV pilus biogenesis protein PilE n=1 Tax=hydrothermal vent metagenome TaxID=652676 RepID=A0A3B0X9J1_9ZZZZ